MSEKKKTDLGKIIIYAAFSAFSVLCLWALRNPRFQSIPGGLVLTGIVAFLSEFLIFKVIRGRKALKKLIRVILLSVVNVAVLACGIAYFFAPCVILQPHRDDASYESLKSVAAAQEITFDGENGKVNGWLYRVSDSAPVILYFYGNYETASTALRGIHSDYENTVFSGCNVAVFDYPAYGSSEGRCSADALRQFALDAFDEVKKYYDDVIVFGYSVGTGPAAYLASKEDIAALILYAPYNSGADLYNNVIDIFHGPLENLVAFDMDSGKYAENITEKTFIAASSGDRVIPVSSSLALSQHLINVSFFDAGSIGHNDFFRDVNVKAETVKFLGQVSAE